MIVTGQIWAKLGKHLCLLKSEAVSSSTLLAQDKMGRIIWDFWEGKKKKGRSIWKKTRSAVHCIFSSFNTILIKEGSWV